MFRFLMSFPVSVIPSALVFTNCFCTHEQINVWINKGAKPVVHQTLSHPGRTPSPSAWRQAQKAACRHSHACASLTCLLGGSALCSKHISCPKVFSHSHFVKGSYFKNSGLTAYTIPLTFVLIFKCLKGYFCFGKSSNLGKIMEVLFTNPQMLILLERKR